MGRRAFPICRSSPAGTAPQVLSKSLTGATPAGIPVEWPTKSELVIDLKTGKILGPKIPDKFLARAGEAIE
jgi:ABC-type uncharacterized transport system substrate-binding protein